MTIEHGKQSQVLSERETEWKDPVWDPPIIDAIRQARSDRQFRAMARSGEQDLPEAYQQALDARRPGFAERIVNALVSGQKVGVSGELTAQNEPPQDRSAAPAASPASTNRHAALQETSQANWQPPEALLRELYESQPSTRLLDELLVDDGHMSLLKASFQDIVRRRRLREPHAVPFWAQSGSGAQGVVFETRCPGADGFCLRAALKLISPEKYYSVASYDDDARRLARVCSRIAWPRHGNIMGVGEFWAHCGIRIMLMELVDGYDLERLLRLEMMQRLQQRLGDAEWSKYQNIVVTPTAARPQLKPFVAVTIIRQCLAGLSSLDERCIVHGDVKPENIMIQRNGQAKIIDFGSAFELGSPPPWFFYTPAYAAIETLERRERTRQSDLASLGYVLIELLAGKRLAVGQRDPGQLIELKRALPQRLEDELPPHVRCNRQLVNFCQRLIAPDLDYRFSSPSEADLHPEDGAAELQRQLVRANLSLVVESELHRWIEAVKPQD